HSYTKGEGGASRNEWRAEGGTRTGRVGAEWIGGNNSFPGRGHPDNVLAIVGKGRSRVRIRSRGDAHHQLTQRRRIKQCVYTVVPRRFDANHPPTLCIVHRARQLL